MPSLPLQILGAAAAAALLVLIVRSPAQLGAQEATALYVDLNPDGNTAVSLGNSDNCISVGVGDTFTIDLTVKDVSTLSAWEVYFVYDRSIVEIVDRELRMFLAAEEGSRPLNASESLPDRDGLLRIAEADLSTPPKAESGSGVLARLTLSARNEGRTFAGLPSIDIDDDGVADYGPRLFAPGGRLIGDGDGDGLFDRPSPTTQVAVAVPCDEASPPPLPEVGQPPVDEEDNSPDTFPGALAELEEPEGPGDGGSDSNSGSQGDSGSGSAAGSSEGQGGGSEEVDGGSGTDDGASTEEGGGEPASGDQPAGGTTDSPGDGPSPWIVGAISFAAVLFVGMALAFVRFARARTF